MVFSTRILEWVFMPSSKRIFPTQESNRLLHLLHWNAGSFTVAPSGKPQLLSYKLQCFGHPMRRADSLERPWCWESLKAEGEDGDRMTWLESLPDSMDMNLGKLQEMVRDMETWCAAVHGVMKNQMWLSDWTPMTSLGKGVQIFSLPF